VREGSEAEGAVVNDSPVGCQSRDLTEPQRDHDPPLQCETIISPTNRNLINTSYQIAVKSPKECVLQAFLVFYGKM